MNIFTSVSPDLGDATGSVDFALVEINRPKNNALTSHPRGFILRFVNRLIPKPDDPPRHEHAVFLCRLHEDHFGRLDSRIGRIPVAATQPLPAWLLQSHLPPAGPGSERVQCRARAFGPGPAACPPEREGRKLAHDLIVGFSFYHFYFDLNDGRESLTAIMTDRRRICSWSEQHIPPAFFGAFRPHFPGINVNFGEHFALW